MADQADRLARLEDKIDALTASVDRLAALHARQLTIAVFGPGRRPRWWG